jgi:DNA topoisomerase-2
MKTKVTEFFKNDYAQSALYQAYRTICGAVDGLKPSSRKIIYTVRKNNITHDIKVSQLAAEVAKSTQYLHGDASLIGVVSNMAMNFTGSNNANLLSPEANFGSRFVPEASAARYVYTKKSAWFDLLFNQDDDDILIRQSFEGSDIECKFFVPVLPIVLLNGSEGIGNGFAQKILPRHANDLIAAIREILKSPKKKSKIDIKPFFKGFNGRIEREEDKWSIYGTFERTTRGQIRITEVPIGYNLAGYKKKLNELVEKKVIKSAEDLSENDQFLFLIRVEKEFLEQTDEKILEILKLKQSITENFTCFDENNMPIEFETANEILAHYSKIRLEYYGLRLANLIKKSKEQLQIASNRLRFITACIVDPTLLTGKNRKDVLAYLTKEKYNQTNGTYDFLVQMPLYSMTIDRVKELEKDVARITQEITDLENKLPKELWLDELKIIESKLGELYES